jgi:DNA-binding MarR family transcriptional regulator
MTMALKLVPNIHRATHRIGLYLAALDKHGMSQGESHILAHLSVSGPASIAELLKILAHRRSTLTSILDRLAERRFITREVGAADRRTFVIRLTGPGRRVARQVYNRLADLERAVAGQVSADQVRAFTRVVTLVEEEAHRRGRAGARK